MSYPVYENSGIQNSVSKKDREQKKTYWIEVGETLDCSSNLREASLNGFWGKPCKQLSKNKLSAVSAVPGTNPKR